jgi:hypothetical protein
MTHRPSKEADFYGTPPLPPEPTQAMPGSEEKILVLMRRAELRLQLHHPGDAGLPLSAAARVFLGFVRDGSGGDAGAEEE